MSFCCIGGVGRTGTLIAILEGVRIKSHRLFPIVDALRHERCWMVQWPEQYILAQRVIEELTQLSRPAEFCSESREVVMAC